MGAKFKRLKDIRYYESAEVPGPGKPIPANRGLLDIPKSAPRVGQRLACILESEDFSVGSYDHVYVVFTPALSEREVVPTNYGFEPWLRYVAYGTPINFKQRPEADKLRHVEAATFEILHELRPDAAALIESVRSRVNKQGARTRVLRATKETKAYRFDVWFDVPAFRDKAYLYVTARDNASGRLMEAPPMPLADYNDIFPLVSTITFTSGILNLNPRRSFQAGLSTSRYETPIRIPLSRFAPQETANDV